MTAALATITGLFTAVPAQAAPLTASSAGAKAPADAGPDGGGSHGRRGADLPFTEYAATGARSNGTRIGPSGDFGTLASEAVARRAVTLTGRGKYVEFTLTKPANAVDLHYSIPDAADGTGLTAPLAVYVNGSKSRDLTLTSKYAWFYGNYPFSNNPADGKAHHFYDDVRTTFAHTLPAGTRVRLQVDAGSTPVTVDVADFERVDPPAHQPHGALSVLDFGADASGRKDSTTAIQQAIDAGAERHRTVWIPVGTFTVTGHLAVDNVTVRGAGAWHSVLTGRNVGIYGNAAPTPSTHVHLSDFAVFGEAANRDDSAPVNGIGGALGGGSTIKNLWIAHTKVGMWFDGPFDGLAISDVRIQDVTGDGLNFHDGISHATVKNSYIRNTGDDGLAMWSGGHADHDNAFSHNTVVLPILANNIALYGGHDNAITDNLVTDTLTQGGGIHVGNRFGAVALSGTTTIARNTLVRTGVLDPNWLFGVGALWFYALDEPMTGRIDVTDTTIVDSPYEAIQFIGSSVTNADVRRVVIHNAGTFAVQEQAAGSATFSDVTATGLGAAGVYDCGYGFTLTKGEGNRGWDTSQCGFPPNGVLRLSDSSKFLGVVDPGSTSANSPVTVTNPGPNPARLASITANGDFSQTNDCGTTLAVGATCTVQVAFTPTAKGNHGGALTIVSDTPFSPYTVSLSGVGYDPNGNLALGRTMTVSSNVDGFPAAFTNDANPSTYWESRNGVFPQWLQADLGAATGVGRLVLTIPPTWGSRAETLSVETSTDGVTYTPAVASTGYVFDPATGNSVTVTLPATSARYIRLNVTGNTDWAAAQIAEFEVYAQ
ncbi:discoidin domain-containing protein [Streptomyces sp. H10-C2]|uniref:discoidin domain-containing protein n=1 Tax=unclassified Streptomyces TaxID=2593676 RepID=UPI0024BBC069|nr:MULTISPECIES: discoidin domain-containing protein [unclassified Streptomyces]MDJ0347189.1 discoidin domain-containing protein [Streptomyces sp. PH10-H1]MDJ0370338.1 discoidin domain-containing protein [Streptomyces sp. H10-C2]